jgi:hypothetical protein
VERCAISHAQALGVLLRSIVVEREPLYRQQETVHEFAPQLYGLSGEHIQHLSDDRVGRALDRLFDADRAALLTWIKNSTSLSPRADLPAAPDPRLARRASKRFRAITNQDN